MADGRGVKLIQYTVDIKAMVSSENAEGAFYLVDYVDGKWKCSCPHFTNRGAPCKHIMRARETIKL